MAGLTLLAGNRSLAEDAIQEAIARAWERSDRGERIESLKAWVTVVASNLLRSWFRRMIAEARANRKWGKPPEETAPPPEDRVDLRRAISDLPDHQRRVVVLHYFADLSLEDVADLEGTTPGAVKSMLYRARRALAASIRFPEPEPEEVNDPAANR